MQTPFFKEELLTLKQDLEKDELKDFMNAMIERQDELCGALTLFKNSLEYKLGIALIKNHKKKFFFFKMPFVWLKIYLQHKFSAFVYQIIAHHNPNLELPHLNAYSDYPRVLEAKSRYQSYKFGLVILNAYKTWYKGGFFKLAKNLKSLQKEFKKH